MELTAVLVGNNLSLVVDSVGNGAVGVAKRDANHHPVARLGARLAVGLSHRFGFVSRWISGVDNWWQRATFFHSGGLLCPGFKDFIFFGPSAGEREGDLVGVSLLSLLVVRGAKNFDPARVR